MTLHSNLVFLKRNKCNVSNIVPQLMFYKGAVQHIAERQRCKTFNDRNWKIWYFSLQLKQLVEILKLRHPFPCDPDLNWFTTKTEEELWRKNNLSQVLSFTETLELSHCKFIPDWTLQGPLYCPQVILYIWHLYFIRHLSKYSYWEILLDFITFITFSK